MKICQISNEIFQTLIQLQNFHNSSTSWKITPLYFCSSNVIYFGHKEPTKTHIFSSAWDKICKVLHCQLYHSSLSWHITPLWILISYIFYLDKRIPLKFYFSHFWVLWWKFAKLHMSFSMQQVSFFLKFVSLLMSWKITPLYFFSSNNIYFAQKEPIKMKIFKTFKCSGQNLSNSSYQVWNDKPVALQILSNSSLSWQITPRWILSSHFSSLD